ncbi:MULTISPECIES: methyltransferase domain-containing protein [Bizionia]|uniref:Methyltransferase domain-containing protein n=1 Tax=Bizionia algoritergicola TaxID=291187 RepID=A0A5D0R1D0_9FLAO|nr:MULTISPECIES: methyltransferase domain-containing protein [Bizionia]OBX22450.1 SAM-dependent methyltransferase [Bizionia sp. APA-3]TYB74651.1 methyltransferase domain-containing protein [Bizionia algoritergicola]
MDLSETFWDSRYQNQDIGWDLGEVSLPIKTYIDQLKDTSLKILIPGAGNSYEAEYLFLNGFKNVCIADLSKTALDNFKNRVPSFPDENLLHINVFDMKETFDIIIEQTFFCALNPNLREAYAKKMHSLLNPNGKLVGLLFDKPLFTERPPFGGSKAEYVTYFKSYFDFDIFEASYNSMTSREDSELFIKLLKK